MATNPSPKPLGGTGAWSQLLADDFNGPGLDAAKWKTSGSWAADQGRGNHGNGQREWMTAYPSANYTIANSILTLTAKREVVQATYTWTSGQICTLAAFTTGWVECRARFPVLQGFQPALWTWGSAGNADRQEVDAFEFYSDGHSNLYLDQAGGNRYIPPAFTTPGTSGPVIRVQNPPPAMPTGLPPSGVSPFPFNPTVLPMHVYGVDIQSNKVECYVDGVKCSSTLGVPQLPWNVIFYLVVSDDGTETPTNRAPAAAPGTNAETCDVDWIRVWQRS